MKSKTRWHDLIGLYQVGNISDEDLAELESGLRESAELRALFHRACRIDSHLQRSTEEMAEEGSGEESVTHNTGKVFAFPGVGNWRVSWLDAGLAAAVVILLSTLIGSWMARPKIIATIVSTEDAAWESALPTAPGSRLTAGDLRLTAGIAKIRFRSGAEMMLEAPAKLSIETPMRARLDSGAAVMNVPESAIGFILDTPDGRVVDHGTSFAVSVDDKERKSTIEVIEGEVSVHHPGSGEEVRLKDREAASLTGELLSTWEGSLLDEEPEETATVTRIGTGGRSHSVHRANKEKWMHPDKLMVKRRNKETNHERRSFFSFDLSEVDLDAVESVRLRLNQVPSGIGYASRLPRISDIAVYGLTNEAKADWSLDATWEDGPAAEDGVLLGHLQIPRSQQRGSRFFEGEALLPFLREHRGGSVTFILDGQVDPGTGERVPSLVIAFASDTHPEAAGPMLEFTRKE